MLTANWRVGSQGRIGSRDIARRAGWTVEMFDRLGVRVTRGSRLLNARDLLVKLNAEELVLARDDQALQERVSDAHKTIWELFVIAAAAGRCVGRRDAPFTVDKLRLIIGGADLVSQDKNKLARNTQFELYVAAMLVHGGAEVQLGEPDLRLLYCGEFVGVAVKRLNTRNPDKIDENVKKAAEQIGEHAGKGFVAINIDILYRGAKRPASGEQRYKMFSERVAEVVAAGRKRLSAAKHVKGLFVFGHVTAWGFDGETPAIETSYPTSFLMISDEGDPAAVMECGTAFVNGVQARMDNELNRLSS